MGAFFLKIGGIFFLIGGNGANVLVEFEKKLLLLVQTVLCPFLTQYLSVYERLVSFPHLYFVYQES